MEQTPVSFRKALEEFADLEMVGGHGANAGHQFLADIFGDGLLIDFGGQVVAALRGIFVQRTLEEIQRLVDLALELLLAEAKDFMWFAHKYAYIYAYYLRLETRSSRAEKSQFQTGKEGVGAKLLPRMGDRKGVKP